MKTDPALRDIARLCLLVGRRLLEWGGHGRVVNQAITQTATGLGCEVVEAYIQHAAVIVMLHRGQEECMQMGKVGEHGVNLRHAEALLKIVQRVASGTLDAERAEQEIAAIPESTHRYPDWLTCLATGLACAAFGRLLQSDWLSMLPVALGASLGQAMRIFLLHRRQNIFLITTAVSFTASLIAGFGSRMLGSETLDIATISAVLLLVPGTAILNAQMDAINGKYNLAASRAVRVIFIFVFLTISLVVAQHLVGIR